MDTNRRDFIKKSAAATAVIGITSSFPTLNAGILGANEKLVCGVIGVNGMGFSDLKAFLKQPNTECAALCDVDDNVLQKRIKDVEKIQGIAPDGYKDFRKLLEHKGLDVIIIGNQGFGKIKELLIGSVTHKVFHAAHCTCITVK